MKGLIKAGFAKVDITPGAEHTIGRLAANVDVAGKVHSPLFARMAVFADASEKVLMIGIDNSGVKNSAIVNQIRSAVADESGLKAENILIASSHTHNSPHIQPWNLDDLNDFSYLDFLIKHLTKGTGEAIANLVPVHLKAGTVQAPGFAHNRRPVHRGKDGREQVRTHGPMAGDDYIANESPDDNELKILIAERADGSCHGGIVNFASHPTHHYGLKAFSSDFIGPLTDALQDKYRSVFVFINGASGDVTNRSLKKEEVRWPQGAEVMGKGLAKKAEEAISNAELAELDTPITVKREIISIPQRCPSKKQIMVAREYLSKIIKNEAIDESEFPRQMYGCDYTFYHLPPGMHEWLANAVIGLWEYQRRVGTRETSEEIEIQVIKLGEIAFVAYPAEMFSQYGVQTRNDSPFKHTFIAQMANGWHGYIPLKESFEHGGYECCLGDHSRLIPVAGSIMLEAALRLLKNGNENE